MVCNGLLDSQITQILFNSQQIRVFALKYVLELLNHSSQMFFILNESTLFEMCSKTFYYLN